MSGLRGRILCIEDDDDTCEMLTLVFAQAGYDFASAPSLYDGLEMARQGGFDLIMLDSYLPDGAGIELCRAIREFDELTPILFYTGEAHGSQVEEAIRAGAQGYMVKPVEIDELLGAVSEHLRVGNVSEGVDRV
jgi:DNA-binding response OmpR family regulator